MKKGLKIALGIILVLVIAVVVVFFDAIKVLASGQLDGVIKKPEKVAYEGSTDENLKALQTALLLYYDNEDHFPEAPGWMDAVKPMLRAANLKAGEDLKKLKNPGLGPLAESEYGFAYSDEISGKNKADLKNPNPVLVFESPDNRAYNAHGDPKSGKGKGIDLKGDIKPLGG